MRKTTTFLVAGTASITALFWGAGAIADDGQKLPGDVGPGDSWKVAPYDFKFGNHLDTHVQVSLKTKKGQPKSLRGTLYVYFTGTIDGPSGLPIARHPRGANHPNETCGGVNANICVAGWTLSGRPGAAKFLYHSGVNGNDHPVWMVNRAETTPGMVIPQPGNYSHYHWITATSTDPRDVPEDSACNKSSAGALEDIAPSAVNEICEGWFLQIKATQSFAFQHGGEIIPIHKGSDIRSHLNIVTNYFDFPDSPEMTITPTR